MRQLDYGLFDADNHFYETKDCFSRYMEPRYRDKAVRLVPGENGKEQLMVGNKPFTFLQHPFPEKHAKPGSLRKPRGAPRGDGQAGAGGLLPLSHPGRLRPDEDVRRIMRENAQGLVSERA